MRGKKARGLSLKAIVLNLLKALLFAAGAVAAVTFFFSWIAILIGGLFYFGSRGAWRGAGYALALAAALASNGPLRGFDVITGIYPLFLAALVVGATLGLYFLFLLLYQLMRRAKGRRAVLPGLEEKLYRPGHSHRRQRLASVLLFFIPLALWVSVNVNPALIFDNRPAVLWVQAPSTVAPGEEFAFQVQCWDRFERLSALYDGTVSFSLESYRFPTGEPLGAVEAVLPEEYTFSGSNYPSDAAYLLDNGRDNGRCAFRARIDTPGVHYIKVRDSETGRTYYSNPILAAAGVERIYWGDIHTHGSYSDGSGTPAHQFLYARHVAALDFYALTEHGEIIQLGRNRIARYVQETNRAYRPGEFVTFLGMEYTNHNTGHYTCIFDGDKLPERSPVYAPYVGLGAALPTPFELWALLDDFTASTGARVLALPHHTVVERFMQDWTYYNPRYVKIAEVTSTHGDNLYEPDHPLSYRGSTFPPPPGTRGCSITGALQMGLQLSLYASSDSHDGHPGHDLAHTGAWVGHQRPFTYWWTRYDKPYPGGLTAVYATGLTRREIFSALENRRLYAVSDHGRPLLFFTINGTAVGGDSTVRVESRNTPRHIEVIFAQDGAPTAPVVEFRQPDWKATVEIHKNGSLLAAIPVDKPLAVVTFTDTEPVTGTSYGRENCVYREGAYYINEYSDNPVDPKALHTGGKDFYIVRVVSENGRHSYIGPLWVKVAP